MCIRDRLNGIVDNVCISHDLTIVKSDVSSNSNELMEGSDQSMSVYPNPSNTGVFNVSFKIPQKTEILVYNIAGEVVLSQSIETAYFLLDLSKQPKGMYILKTIAGNETIVSRIVRD